MKTEVKTIKVVAEVRDVTQPEYEANFKCPYCSRRNYIDDLEEENITVTHKCIGCKGKFKVKIPKYM